MEKKKNTVASRILESFFFSEQYSMGEAALELSQMRQIVVGVAIHYNHCRAS